MEQIVYLLILGWVTSLLSITPDKTRESSSSPPGIYNKIILSTPMCFPVTGGSMYYKCKDKKVILTEQQWYQKLFSGIDTLEG